MLKKVNAEISHEGAEIVIRDAAFPSPFVSGLEYAKAEREYLGEKIGVEWRRVDGEIKVTVTAPDKFNIVRKY